MAAGNAGETRLLAVKLGGAAITHKATQGALNSEALGAVAGAVAGVVAGGTRCVLVHGAGSFGHHEALEHGLTSAAPASAARCLGAALTHAAVRRLNGAVVEALLAAGLPAVGVSPLPAWRADGDASSSPWADVAALLDAGLLPVLHGDVVLHADAAVHVAVLGGDQLMAQAAAALPVAAAVFLSSTPLCTAAPESVPDGSPPRVARVLLAADGGPPQLLLAGAAAAAVDTAGGESDATGGIAEKLREAQRMAAGAPVLISAVGPTLPRTLLAAAALVGVPPHARGSALAALEASASGTLVLNAEDAAALQAADKLGQAPEQATCPSAAE